MDRHVLSQLQWNCGHDQSAVSVHMLRNARNCHDARSAPGCCGWSPTRRFTRMIEASLHAASLVISNDRLPPNRRIVSSDKESDRNRPAKPTKKGKKRYMLSGSGRTDLAFSPINRWRTIYLALVLRLTMLIFATKNHLSCGRSLFEWCLGPFRIILCCRAQRKITVQACLSRSGWPDQGHLV